jgi:glycosyltransferase involved in cell wall biosynthesis
MTDATRSHDWPALADPAISVLICNYNYARYVAAAIESVLAQTRPAHRILVVDDGSTDGSRDVIAGFADRVEIHHRPNGGQIAAVNDGLAMLDGDIVMILDADDLLEPSALATIATGFAAGVVKLHFPLALIDGDGIQLGGTIPRRLDDGDVKARIITGDLYDSSPGSGNAYRLGAVRMLLPLPSDPTDRHGADYFLMFGIGLLGTVRAIDVPLTKYRVHDRPTSLSFGNAHRKRDSGEVRGRRLAAWIDGKFNLRIVSPVPDFSAQKVFFAADVLACSTYLSRVRVGLGLIRGLLPSIRRFRSQLPGIGMILILWAYIVVLAPKPLAEWAARKVCNPSAR